MTDIVVVKDHSSHLIACRKRWAKVHAEIFHLVVDRYHVMVLLANSDVLVTESRTWSQ